MRNTIAILVSFLFSTTLALALGFLGLKMSSTSAVVCLLAGLGAGIWARYTNKLNLEGLPWKNYSIYSWVCIGSVALFSLRAFGWVMFKKGNEWAVMSPNNLGDMSLHVLFIKFFALGGKIWPENPIFAGTQLHYPFGVDLFNSLLVAVGHDLSSGLILVGLFLGAATILSFLFWGGPFVLGMYYFSGGLAGFSILLSYVFKDYQGDLAWKNLFLSMLITQRGLLYAIPAGLVLLSAWRWRILKTGPKMEMPLFLEWLFYATMPIFHTHTFIFLSLMLGGFVVLGPKAHRTHFLKLIGFSLLPAGFLMGCLTDFFTAPSMVHIRWGWMQDNQNFFSFWLLNFGVFWPLIFVWLYQSRKLLKTDTYKLFILPALGQFLIFCVVMLAPWEWDNTKILFWSYIVLSTYLGSEFIQRLPRIVMPVTIGTLLFSGVVSVIGGIGAQHAGYGIFKLDETYSVSSAVRDLPIEEKFAGSATYNHPLFFAGRKMVAGYSGHIWSHGLAGVAPQRESDLKTLMMGAAGWDEIARKLGVRYIFWGERERVDFKDSAKPWEQTAKLIASGSWGKIYDIGAKP